MDASEAVGCAPHIINALRSEHRWLENAGPEELERGLMAYYDDDDGVERKVQSYWFNGGLCQFWTHAKGKIEGAEIPIGFPPLEIVTIYVWK